MHPIHRAFNPFINVNPSPNPQVDRPPDPWQQLAAASALSGPRSRRASLANTAALAATGGAAEDPEAAAGAAGQGACGPDRRRRGARAPAGRGC